MVKLHAVGFPNNVGQEVNVEVGEVEVIGIVIVVRKREVAHITHVDGVGVELDRKSVV